MSYLYCSQILIHRTGVLSSTRISTGALDLQAEKGTLVEVSILSNNGWSDFQKKKKYDGVFLRCLEREDASKIVKELHDRPAGGHYSGDTTAHKILRAGYY